MSTYDLQLQKGGILVIKDWSPELEKYTERQIDTEDLVFYLNDSICLDKGVYLKDIFLLLKRDIAFFSIITSCPVLENLVLEGLADSQMDKGPEEISFLEIKRIALIFKDEYDGNKYLKRYMELSGINDDERYAVEFIPANMLAPYPVFINESVDVLEQDVDEPKVVFSYYEKLTLVELLNGVVNELAFIGGTEEKSIMMEKLKDQLKEIDDGNCEFKDYDEVMENLKKNIEKNKIECVYCKDDTRSPHFGKPDNVCYKCFKRERGN